MIVDGQSADSFHDPCVDGGLGSIYGGLALYELDIFGLTQWSAYKLPISDSKTIEIKLASHCGWLSDCWGHSPAVLHDGSIQTSG